MWRFIKPQTKYVNAGSDVLASLIIALPRSPLAKMCPFVFQRYNVFTNRKKIFIYTHALLSPSLFPALREAISHFSLAGLKRRWRSSSNVFSFWMPFLISFHALSGCWQQTRSVPVFTSSHVCMLVHVLHCLNCPSQLEKKLLKE